MSALRRATAVLLAILVTAGTTAASSADTEAPKLVSIAVSRADITVAATDVELLTVSVRLTDDVGVVDFDDFAGGHTPFLAFGSTHVPVKLDFGTGTAKDGVWTGVLPVTSDWAATEQPVKVVAQDDAGNYLDVDPRTVIDVPAVTVHTSRTPVVDLTVSSPFPNGAVTLTVRATDRDTGRTWRDLPVAVGYDNACAENVQSGASGTTDRNGLYREVLPAGQMYEYWMCTWVPAANVPGQWATQIGGDGASVRYKFVVSAAPAAASVRAGTNVDVNGHLYPAVGGKALQLQRLYGTEWRTVSTGVTRSSSRFTIVATPPGVGTYSYRVYAPGDANHVGNTSAAFTIRGT